MASHTVELPVQWGSVVILHLLHIIVLVDELSLIEQSAAAQYYIFSFNFSELLNL